MAKTISLTDLIVKSIILDYEKHAVIVPYEILDSDGLSWISGEATFWVTLPPQVPIYSEDGSTIVGYEPYPDSWFELPAEYAPILQQLRADADVAMTTRFLS